MKVLKFGGSSVGTPDRVLGVKKIVEGQTGPGIIVVSAFQGITDQLEQVSQMACKRDEAYKKLLIEIENRHYDAVKELFPVNQQSNILAGIKVLINELEETLYGVYLLQDLTRKTQDAISSFGERLSAFIISLKINKAYLVEIRDLIKTDNNFGKANVLFNLSTPLIKEHFKSLQKYAIVPGFIASNDSGETTTLGRGGSDYTAAILAAALDVSVLEIWTDVDGFMTADPRKVNKAYAIESLSYAEAMELSHFGARVLYTPTIQPVLEKRIRIHIKNTFSPEKKGTLIGGQERKQNQSPIKGISSIDKIDLITLQGSGMVGVTGTSMRLFGALAKRNINIILITQASSEYSISFAIHPDSIRDAEQAIQEEFMHEIDNLHSIRVLVERELSIIAIVGEKMRHTPGISAKLFQSLGRNGVNVIGIAQGSSELNISVVISHASLRKALNVIHEGFFLSHYKELHLFFAGVGTVGSSLLEQVRAQQEKLLINHRLKINLIGLTNSRKMLINQEGIDIEQYTELLSEGLKANLSDYIRQISALNLRNSVFIDCTSSAEVSETYKELFNNYVSVVTANKIACSSAYDAYRDLKNTAQSRDVKFIYETNVGAGLPIINTINDLIHSGDKIIELEAVVSGTLNYIFNTIDSDNKLSDVILQAKELGFSEPDPRIDLSGIDVIRKLIILSREAGYRIEEKDVKVSPILPEDCFKGSLDDFWKTVRNYDEEFEKKRLALEKQNKKWRFVARLKNGKASVQLAAVGMDHPLFPLEGSNNIIMITTERYREHPMIIKGYGAGAEVTAAGMFADVIRIANI
ncbi:MAG TPA: bifunctional aspartate kinase/homoserine dehydrogenase I [Bacteroides sp.]|nr:bifunctional aspartate kinase/homoserine dehydrogenase I [Bacteroides sp.]